MVLSHKLNVTSICDPIVVVNSVGDSTSQDPATNEDVEIEASANSPDIFGNDYPPVSTLIPSTSNAASSATNSCATTPVTLQQRK